jgi:hypothetical protein
MAKRFFAGVLIGVPGAIAGVVFGIPGMAVAILAVALIALVPRLPLVLAGGLVGLGATWLVLFTRQALLCAQPDQVCGGTPIGMVPWLAFSAAILLAGVLTGGVVLRRASRT